MKRMRSLCLLALCPIVLSAQQPPQPTQLPGDVFVIKTAWFIGGTGPWDYLTMDPVARRLFIAHGAQVQVVDVETGAVAGQSPDFTKLMRSSSLRVASSASSAMGRRTR